MTNRGCKETMFRKVKFVASVQNGTFLAVLIAFVNCEKIRSLDI